MHVAMEDLPFGGVGPSGMGSYHGVDGFRQFSHRKAIYQQPTSNFIEKQLRTIRAPYGEAIQKGVDPFREFYEYSCTDPACVSG
jgi:coniferyl-aldehyde dehydrogenase